MIKKTGVSIAVGLLLVGLLVLLMQINMIVGHGVAALVYGCVAGNVGRRAADKLC